MIEERILHLLFRTVLIVGCIVLFSAAFAFAAADLSLTLDSLEVQTEAPPLIRQDYTLVPVRALFEAMGGKVDWNSKTGKISIAYDNTTVVMTVGSKIAKVNGEDQEMQVAAQILTAGRTYIPVRFAASALGFGVDWNGEERRVLLTSPGYVKAEPTVEETEIDLTETGSGEDELAETETDSGEEEIAETEPVSSLPKLDSRMAGKLIFIDAGHGGTDPGCLVKYNGKTHYESAFNLKIAQRLQELLTEAGVNAQLLRSADETVKLLQRPAMANQSMADLYVSIHNNSSISPAPSGTEVFYFAKPTESSYDLTSKELAQSISQSLSRELGLLNRGITSQGTYAVLNKTSMPAVIVEGAFFSNAKDIVLMMSEAYSELYASGVASGIIQALNQAAAE